MTISRGRAQIRQLRDVCPLEERELCQCCGKRLKPQMRLEYHPKNEPPPTATRRWLSQEQDDKAMFEVWRGAFESYGDERFCTLRCAERFAELAHKAGYRIKP